MIITYRYYATGNQALAYITKSKNQKSCEVIFAQRVTNKADLDFGHRERPELPVSLIDFHFQFSNDKEIEVFNFSEDAHDYLYDWLVEMSNQGITFNQFVCFRNEMTDGTLEFHLLCGLINHNRFLQHVANVEECAYNTMVDFFAFNFDNPHPTLSVIGDEYIFDFNAKSELEPSRLLCEEPQVDEMLYGGEDPLCHELIAPYRDEILEKLTHELVG